MTDREERDRELFETIADDYCRKDLQPASRRARKLRLDATLALLPAEARKPSGHLPDVLDVGCGAGFTATYLHGHYRRYVGVDYSRPLIDLAKRHNVFPEATFFAGNAKDLPDIDDGFDLIVMIGVLHHIDDPAAALSEMVGFLRPGGWIVANEPQPDNPVVMLARRARASVDKHYSSEQSYPSAASLAQLYRDAGLTEVATQSQGWLSTPFAETSPGGVAQWLARPLSATMCGVDRMLTKSGLPLRRLAWNSIVAGRRPDA